MPGEPYSGGGPVPFECPQCGGAGCSYCNDGHWDLTLCPLAFVTADIWRAIEFADLYRKGIPLVAGGALDQPMQFVRACRLIWAEQDRWKSKMMDFSDT